MNHHFRNRIAKINTIAVAILLALVFSIIYAVVYYTSYRHLDGDLVKEKTEAFAHLIWQDTMISVNDMPSHAATHQQMEANPTFIQVVDNAGKILFKSDNLKDAHFLFNPATNYTYFFNDVVNGQRMRLGQFPIISQKGKVLGHLTAGTSRQEAYLVLHNLFLILLVSYLFILVVLFIVMRYAASRAILPVKELIHTAEAIHENNIEIRMPLPPQKDEIHQLAATINDLLDRIQKSVRQQQQFTADVSHEMRTPLTAIRGTIEVLLRKERSPEHYQTKLQSLLAQTNRLNKLYDEMLELSRIDDGKIEVHNIDILLNSKVEEIVDTFQNLIYSKQLKCQINIPQNTVVRADNMLLERILSNLISNAIKYNKVGGAINITWQEHNTSLKIIDQGVGIQPENLPLIFNRFYRTDDSRSGDAEGNGIGLFLVKRFCDVQHIAVEVESLMEKGTTFSLYFPQKN